MDSQAGADLHRVAAADPERAWGSFLEDCTATVERAVQRVAKDPEEVRNLVVDVLERIRVDWPALLARFEEGTQRPGRPRVGFRPWLAVVARNLAIDSLRARYGRPTMPRSVERMSALHQELYRLLYGERLTLPEAWERLRDGAGWSGTFGELAAEVRGLEDGLPHSARVASAGLRRPERGRGGADDDPGEPGPDPAADSLRPDELLQHQAVHEALRRILAGWTGDQRLLLRVYFLEGATARDTARITGASSPSRVYDGVHRLLAQMRDELRDAGLGSEDSSELMDFDWFEHLSGGKP